MLATPVLRHIVSNDALTRGLGDAEARILVEWLVEQAELFALAGLSESNLSSEVERLCRRGRAISRFVVLWCHDGQRGAACQLAGAERFSWPLPTSSCVDPCELMESILDFETRAAA